MTNRVDGISLQRVTIRKRKDPLDDLTSLDKIAKLATKTARERAFKNGAYIVISKNRVTYKVFSDGREEVLKDKDKNSIPRIEDDLWLA